MRQKARRRCTDHGERAALTDRASSEAIDWQAAQWAARMCYDDFPADMAAEFNAWIEADRRHRGAYLRARAGLYVLEDQVLGQATPPIANDNDNAISPVSRPRRGRAGRHAVLMYGMIAVFVTAATLGLSRLSLWAPHALETAPRQQETALPDGTMVALGPSAQVDFAIEDGVRRATLLRGAATFRVAKGHAEPFMVRAGAVYAQAMGTIYTVRRVGDLGAAVQVEEGRVLVWRRGERPQAVLLRAGDALTLDGASHKREKPSPATRVSPAAEIALDDLPISAAAQRFNRLNRQQIVISDPEIGETTIVGLFQGNQPLQFAEAAAAVSGGEVHVDGLKIEIKVKQNSD